MCSYWQALWFAILEMVALSMHENNLLSYLLLSRRGGLIANAIFMKLNLQMVISGSI